MARVDHKKIRKLIAEKKRSINDRQFFTSRLMAGHFADIAATQTRSHGINRKVKVKIDWAPKDAFIAATDKNLILINAGNKFVTKRKTRPDRYEIVCGMFAHELGHVLYTNFLLSDTYDRTMEDGRWYPVKPPLANLDEQEAEAEIKAFWKADKKNIEAFQSLAFELNNIVEDGFIENKMILNYPGVLGSCLKSFTMAHFHDSETVTECIELEDSGDLHIWRTIMQLILSYVKWGEIKYGDEPLSDERIQTVFSLLPDLDKALIDPNPKARWHVVNIIMVRCWHYIKDFLEMVVSQSNAQAGAGNSASPGEIIAGIASSLSGATAPGQGDSSPVDETIEIPIELLNQLKRQSTSQQAAASAAGQTSEEAGSEDDQNAKEASADPSESGDPGQESQEVAMPQSNLGKKSEDSASKSAEIEESTTSLKNQQSGPEHVSAEETGRLPYQETTDIAEPVGGETTHDNSYEGAGYTHAAADIERILESMAEKSVCEVLENTRVQELNQLARSIPYGNVHSGVDITVHRITSVSEEMADSYNTIAGELKRISRRLQKSVEQQQMDKRTGGKRPNLIAGRRIHTPALSRNDGKVFYKTNLPNDVPELCFALLLDESGSMSSKDRTTYARSTAIIMEDFCRSLYIPVMIYGHSTNGGDVDLYSYVEFDQIDRDDPYRLMDISSRNTNRDGAAIRFVTEQLAQRPEESKIFMLISDGQPNHDGYKGTSAEDDLRGIMQECKRKGILFIAASIGDDKNNLRRIYNDAFMDITDLNKLPYMMTEVIKHHLKAVS